MFEERVFQDAPFPLVPVVTQQLFNLVDRVVKRREQEIVAGDDRVVLEVILDDVLSEYVCEEHLEQTVERAQA